MNMTNGLMELRRFFKSRNGQLLVSMCKSIDSPQLGVIRFSDFKNSLSALQINSSTTKQCLKVARSYNSSDGLRYPELFSSFCTFSPRRTPNTSVKTPLRIRTKNPSSSPRTPMSPHKPTSPFSARKGANSTRTMQALVEVQQRTICQMQQKITSLEQTLVKVSEERCASSPREDDNTIYILQLEEDNAALRRQLAETLVQLGDEEVKAPEPVLVGSPSAQDASPPADEEQEEPVSEQPHIHVPELEHAPHAPAVEDSSSPHLVPDFITFDPSRKGSGCEITEDGRGVTHGSLHSYSTACIGGSVHKGVYIWKLRFEEGQMAMFGVHPTAVPSDGPVDFDRALGDKPVRGVGLSSSGYVTAFARGKGGAVSGFGPGAVVEVTLDMDNRRVSWFVNTTWDRASRLLSDDGPHTLAVSLTQGKVSVISCCQVNSDQ
eukprot:gnl/Dysnectes_brevis/2244_a2625_1138.p1 GENE.gnl/Dysnectes_brevis/2244_a2625_1138~~gnl/Dysnectes_brevis/2244_a2625_1138.p1  ORF type:complete len:434 (+),score=76.00 gnl/Dysnectes_brevis/2244_a2625_1138:168-1469(+)